MKMNRKRETTPKREAPIPVSKPIQSEREFYYEETKKEKEIERIKEEKIDEYFKEKNRGVQRIGRTPQIKTRARIIHKPTIIIFIFCIIIGGIYWGGNIVEKADVTITAKHQLVTYNTKQFIASKDTTGNPVDFEIMIVSDKRTKNIILSDSKEVSTKAQGSITLYNEFSTNPIKLSSGTYTMDEGGKTYKVDSTVTIPGYKLDADKKIIPGQTVANISSFLSGDAYNGEPKSFFITSFKGTAKYDKIYGKLKTALLGGAQGVVYTLNDANKTNIDNLAKTYLKEDLMKQVKAQVPPGYILYPDALTFSYKTDDNFISKNPDAEVPMEGTLSVVLLKEQSLIDNIIKISIPNITGDESKEIKISDLNKFVFNFTDANQVIMKEMTTVSFSLTGSVNAIWSPDVDVLKTKLLGVDKNKVLPVFREDKGIASALVKIFPSWKSYIPNDVSKINIIIK